MAQRIADQGQGEDQWSNCSVTSLLEFRERPRDAAICTLGEPKRRCPDSLLGRVLGHSNARGSSGAELEPARSLNSRNRKHPGGFGFPGAAKHSPWETCRAGGRAATRCRESAYRQLHFWDRNRKEQGPQKVPAIMAEAMASAIKTADLSQSAIGLLAQSRTIREALKEFPETELHPSKAVISALGLPRAA